MARLSDIVADWVVSASVVAWLMLYYWHNFWSKKNHNTLWCLTQGHSQFLNQMCPTWRGVTVTETNSSTPAIKALLLVCQNWLHVESPLRGSVFLSRHSYWCSQSSRQPAFRGMQLLYTIKQPVCLAFDDKNYKIEDVCYGQQAFTDFSTAFPHIPETE